jgi:hypothetical protein
VIVERELAGLTWYVVSVRFASEYIASETWAKIEAEQTPEMELGFFNSWPTDLITDGPQPGRVLTVVTNRKEGAQFIDRVTRGAMQNGVPEDALLAMILHHLEHLADERYERTRDRGWITFPEAHA